MKRCPNGTRRKNGICVKKSNTKKRCPNGTRRKNGICVKKINTKKRCPNGSQRKNGICVPHNKKSTNSKEYIITIHNSEQKQIKDLDYVFDDVLDFIEHIEKKINVKNIVPMPDKYISKYIQIMKLDQPDIDNDELASIWFYNNSENKPIQKSYDIDYNDKKYIIKFHNI